MRKENISKMRFFVSIIMFLFTTVFITLSPIWYIWHIELNGICVTKK